MPFLDVSKQLKITNTLGLEQLKAQKRICNIYSIKEQLLINQYQCIYLVTRQAFNYQCPWPGSSRVNIRIDNSFRYTTNGPVAPGGPDAVQTGPLARDSSDSVIGSPDCSAALSRQDSVRCAMFSSAA
jgi:hypothetical protein